MFINKFNDVARGTRRNELSMLLKSSFFEMGEVNEWYSKKTNKTHA